MHPSRYLSMVQIQTKKISVRRCSDKFLDTYRVIIPRERSDMKLYKANEIAKILKIPVRTVYRLGREGKLKRVKVGRAVRFVLPEMEESIC